MNRKWKDLTLQMEGAHQEFGAMNRRPIVDKVQGIREKLEIFQRSKK